MPQFPQFTPGVTLVRTRKMVMRTNFHREQQTAGHTGHHLTHEEFFPSEPDRLYSGVTLLYQDPSKPIAWPALLTEDNFTYLNLWKIGLSNQERGQGFSVCNCSLDLFMGLEG